MIRLDRQDWRGPLSPITYLCRCSCTHGQQVVQAQTLCKSVFNNSLSIYSILFIYVKPWPRLVLYYLLKETGPDSWRGENFFSTICEGARTFFAVCMTGRRLFLIIANDGAETFFFLKNDGAGTFFCKKNDGAGTFFCEKNDGAKTFFLESKMGANTFLKRQNDGARMFLLESWRGKNL